jgi:hypothetical protein
MGFSYSGARPPIKGHQRSEWMRPTWYSPPRQQQAKSQLPLNLFERKEGENEEEDADKLGRITRNNGWFNIHSKNFSHIHYKNPQ